MSQAYFQDKTVFIKKELLEELLEGCRNAHPHEFFAMLSSKSGTQIDEYVVVPLVYQTHNSVGYRTDLLPFDASVCGTFHSHPFGSAKPSNADKDSFSKKGQIHIIVSSPFSFENVCAYDKDGKPLLIKLKL